MQKNGTNLKNQKMESKSLNTKDEVNSLAIEQLTWSAKVGELHKKTICRK